MPKNRQAVMILLAAVLVSNIVTQQLLVRFGLPEMLAFLLAIPVLVVARRYPRWLTYLSLAGIIGNASWVAYLTSIHPIYSAASITVAGLTTIFAAEIIHRQVGQYNSTDTRHHIMADFPYRFDMWRNPDGSFAYISPSCEEVTGYPPEKFIRNPKFFNLIVLSEDRYLLGDNSHKTQDKAVFRIHHRDGEERWLEQISQRMYDENGSFLGRRSSNRDITAQRQAEEALVKSSERLSVALESASGGVWDVDMISGSAYLSPTHASSLGLSSDGYYNLDDYHALIHPQDLRVTLGLFNEHANGEADEYESEYRIHMPDGRWRWILDRGQVTTRSPKGKPLRMIGVHLDITERKTIEEALQDSERKFRQLTENMREVFWLRDRGTSNFIYISPAFESVWGLPVNLILRNPKAYSDNIHQEDLERILPAQKALFETGQVFNEEYRITQAGGGTRWVWVREYPIQDLGGQFYRVAGVAEDITERRQTESALRDSEKRYRDLIEHQGGGVGVIDPEDCIVYMNPAGEVIFGAAPGELINRNLKEFLNKEQQAFFLKHSALRHKGVESSFELAITRPDETLCSLLVTTTPRFDVKEKFLGSIIIFRDITERKQDEEKLRYTSTHDSLTGLNNRTYFDEKIIRIDQDQRLFPVSVIMIDLDNLKLTNDNLGHATGDDLLIRSARLLKRAMRSNDAVARIGGDEFAILMPSTDETALQQAILRIRSSILEANRIQTGKVPVGMSIGGSTCHTPGSLTEIIDAADRRMYEDKLDKDQRAYIYLEPEQDNTEDSDTPDQPD
jgi:diguanylate cyclase (GGDEF)-like protein/PAS domain S-box-containing protein